MAEDNYFSDLVWRARPEIKESSHKAYVGNLTRLCNRLKLEHEVDEFIDNYEDIITFLKGMSPSAAKTYLNPILICLIATGLTKDHPIMQKYTEFRDNCNNIYTERSKTGDRTEKETERMITFEEWDGLIKTLNDEIAGKKLRLKGNAGKRDYEVILFYTLIKLFRKYALRNDFAIMKVVTAQKLKKLGPTEDFDDYNYCLLPAANKTTGGQFILNNYKTSKRYGQIIIDLDSEDVKSIRFLLKVSPNPDVLVSDYDGMMFSRNKLSRFLIRMFQKYLHRPISTQILRKSYLSEKYGDINKEMNKDAVIMGHSRGVQADVYIRND
jgi:hypothetical protein